MDMEPMQAMVLTSTQLEELVREAVRQGAALAVAELRQELRKTPDDMVLQSLRAYLNDADSVSNPQECWAHGGIIRQLAVTPRGKPKSAAWLVKFQRESGLAECLSRPSPTFGRRREWSFADIRLAWNAYYRRR